MSPNKILMEVGPARTAPIPAADTGFSHRSAAYCTVIRFVRS